MFVIIKYSWYENFQLFTKWYFCKNHLNNNNDYFKIHFNHQYIDENWQLKNDITETNYNDILTNVDVGFPVFDVLSVDIHIGGVLRLSKYYRESHFTKYKKWNNIDYSGVLPTAGISIGILK